MGLAWHHDWHKARSQSPILLGYTGTPRDKNVQLRWSPVTYMAVGLATYHSAFVVTQLLKTCCQVTAGQPMNAVNHIMDINMLHLHLRYCDIGESQPCAMMF